jgi:RimJ/RimL family protein N-acetyltransferase
MELRTPRLLLREYEEDDWVAVHRYGSNPDVMRFITYSANTEEDTQNFIQRVRVAAVQDPRQKWELAITSTADGGLLIGGCGLWWTHADNHEAEIGYLLDPTFWRKGIAAEAARALLGFAFTQLGAHRVIARCNADNPASARVMEKGGMQREAHFRQKLWGHGRWWDEYVYAILDAEWSQANRKSG